MAKNSLVMGYILRKNKNEESSSYDRWFAFVDRMGVLSTRGLAEHMIEHGLVNNRSEVEGVLAKLSECMLHRSPVRSRTGLLGTETGISALLSLHLSL